VSVDVAFSGRMNSATAACRAAIVDREQDGRISQFRKRERPSVVDVVSRMAVSHYQQGEYGRIY
jgi:hypothetical protein